MSPQGYQFDICKHLGLYIIKLDGPFAPITKPAKVIDRPISPTWPGQVRRNLKELINVDNHVKMSGVNGP